jgi:hypothetical protein
MENMNKILCKLSVIMLCCSSMCADLQRELQHEIDYINITLTDHDWSDLEKEYLRGRSEGLFRAMEICHEHGVI